MAEKVSPDSNEHVPPSLLEGLVDEMLAHYLEWRLHAGAVAEAYRHWSRASRAEQASRFTAYMAALDQEAAAAASYAVGVKAAERRTPRDLS
jgi:hypothetical protein